MAGNSYSTPADISAALSRLGVRSSERTQQLIRLEALTEALRQEVGRLALAAKALADAAEQMARE